MNQFLSLVRQRFARQRDRAIGSRIRDDVNYIAEVAAGRLQLANCDSIGMWVRVVGRARVENRGRITVGERGRLICDFAPVELLAASGGEISIGAQASINYGTVISATKRVTLGDRVSVGPYCIIADSEVSGRGDAKSLDIEIGNDVWLASRVTVLPGTRIGDGAVVTAGSIVSGVIPARVVAGGHPARVLRHLDGANAPVRAAHVEVALPIHPTGSNGTAHVRDGAPTAPIAPAYRGLLIADFTLDDFCRVLEADASSPVLGARPAAFGQVVPALIASKDAADDYAIVWTRPEGVLASFAKILDYESVDHESLLSEVDQFAALLVEGLRSYRFAFVPTWTLPPWRRGRGVVDARGDGATRALYAINQRLIEKIAHEPNIFVLNAQRWIDEAGRGAHSHKLWYMGKVPFHSSVFEQAALDIKAAIQGLTGMARKLVVVDLDDTLWGGIVGDVGWEQLRLGGHDSEGEAFVDFQRALKSLKRRGILLAVVSKNDEGVALEAIRSHREMILREDDFVAWRINWQDKARNISELVAGLNLGLQSTVFIDDNPFERARVREALPDVFVPEWPEDKLAYASALMSLRCFDAPAVSGEDLARTEMYAADRKREELKSQVGSLDDWLRGLQIRVRAEPLSAANVVRTTQLLNKTNQLNLSTRRLTESELTEWASQPEHWLWALTVSDRLGDAGLTGILSLKREGTTARIVDFVLSCRVMGRRVEETMVHLAVDAAKAHSFQRVVAELIPTAKNRPCAEFWQRSGFQSDGNVFSWDIADTFALPDVISLERAS